MHGGCHWLCCFCSASVLSSLLLLLLLPQLLLLLLLLLWPSAAAAAAAAVQPTLPWSCSTSQELLACYALIEQRGRGVVYYGSARLKQSSPHWVMAVELGREVSTLLGSTTWSGA